MKYRCLNPAADQYKNYGARGITACDRWIESFENFYADMGPRPGGKREYSIEREDNNGNYEPGNCRWATQTEQLNNKRETVYVVVDGVRTPLSMAARAAGIDPSLAWSRIRLGWNPENAVTVPVLPQHGRQRDSVTGQWTEENLRIDQGEKNAGL